jgi:gamma-glutamyltranspeptidase/glutathione hydrolase
VLLNITLGGMGIQQAIEYPRVDSQHMHQSFGDKRDAPGLFEVEDRIPMGTLTGLVRRGHQLLPVGAFEISSAMVAVGVDQRFGTLRGGADVRGDRYAFGW